MHTEEGGLHCTHAQKSQQPFISLCDNCKAPRKQDMKAKEEQPTAWMSVELGAHYMHRIP